MKKINIIIQLTVICTIALHSPYCYGVAPATNPAFIPNNATVFVAIPNTSLATLYHLISQGKKAHDAHDYTSAIAFYNQVLEKYAQHYTEKNILLATIYNKLGMSYFALKAYPQSYHYLYQAIIIRHTCLSIATGVHNENIGKSISKTTGQNLHHLGSLYLAIGSHQEAILAFKAALETEWQHAQEATITRSQLAKAYQQGQTYKERNDLPMVPYVNPATIANIEKKLSQITIAMPQPKDSYVNSASIANVEKKLSQINNAITHQIIPPITIATPHPIKAEEKKQREVAENVPKNKLTNPCNSPMECAEPPIASSCAKRRSLLKNCQSGTNNYPKSFECPICHKKFAVKQNIKVHLRVHTGEKPFGCPVCKRKFTTKNNMKVHLRIHTGEKPFQCTVCQRNFSRKEHIKNHMRTHTGEKPFLCPFCGKTFAIKHYMQSHMRVHTGERPFSCPICQKKFSLKQNMKVHIKNVHKNRVLDTRAEQSEGTT